MSDSTSTDLAIPEDDLGLGLEDFDVTDMVMPRIAINGPEATFEDKLSGEQHEELNVVILGLIKQRILWPAEIEEGDSDGPLCKSADFKVGYPNPSKFPWSESGFAAQDGELGEVKLDCASCPLSEWETHPTNSTPWCSEQYTFAILIPLEDGGGFAPAVITFQRSAIKACKTYLTAFSRSKTPLYTCMTKITLEPKKRGSVKYATPKFVKGAETDRDLWGEFGQQYRQVRDFLQTVRFDTGDGNSSDDGKTEAPATDAPAAEQPTAAPAAAQEEAASPAPTAPTATAAPAEDLPF